MKKHTINIALAAILLLLVSSACTAQAVNPADLTSFQRWCPKPYLKGSIEGDIWWDCETLRAGSFNLTHFHWKNPEVASDQLYLIGRVNKRVDLAIDCELRREDAIRHSNLSFDYHPRGFGLGLKATADSKALLGLRFDDGSSTIYATIGRASGPILGVTLRSGSGEDLAIAHGGGSWWFRASKGYGSWYPEIRAQLERKENIFGVAVGYGF